MTSSKKNKWRYVVVGWMIVSAISAFTLYYFFFWSYKPAPTPIQSESFDIEWGPSHGPVFASSEFYSFPITLSFHNYSITQYQEVTVTSIGGIISKTLTKGLIGVEVNYQKSLSFVPAWVGIAHLTDLSFYSLSYKYSNVSDLLVFQTPASHVEWQTVGTDYPIVTLIYETGNPIQQAFPDQTLYVQSETVTNDAMTSAMWHEQEFGLWLILPVFGAMDTIVLALYTYFGPKK